MFEANKVSAVVTCVIGWFLVATPVAGGVPEAYNLEMYNKHGITRGSLGMNLNDVNDWSTEFPFINLAKQSRPWISNRQGRKWGKGGRLDLDEHGWVRSLAPGQRAELVFLTVHKGALPFKRFRVRFTGKGRVRYRGKVRVVKGTASSREHIIQVDDSRSGPVAFVITRTDPSDYIRNISIVPVELAHRFDSGEIFNPLWVNLIQEYRALRFMNWMKTVDSTISRWEERPRVSDYSWGVKGVPLEVMIELANITNSDPWFNMPHMADDEYISRFATFVRDNLSENLTAYVEHSNEVWNWAFPATRYAQKMAKARWGDSVKAPVMQWQGMQTAKICDIWKQKVFRSEKQRVHCVLAVHGASTGKAVRALDCPAWVAEGNKPCYLHGIDSVSITGYFTGCLNGRVSWKGPMKHDVIRKWFQDPDGGMAKGFAQLRSGKYFECKKTLLDKRRNYREFRILAHKKGLELTAYEGGQHVVGSAEVKNDDEFTRFYIRMNRDPRMKTLYLENFNMWKNEGGTLFMHFLDIRWPGKYGSWGALEYLGQNTSPKLEALQKFNRDVNCWWQGCK